jgi:hypothetical protein
MKLRVVAGAWMTYLPNNMIESPADITQSDWSVKRVVSDALTNDASHLNLSETLQDYILSNISSWRAFRLTIGLQI